MKQSFSDFCKKFDVRFETGSIKVRMIDRQLSVVFESAYRWFGEYVSGSCPIRLFAINFDAIIQQWRREHDSPIHRDINDQIAIQSSRRLDDGQVVLQIVERRYFKVIFEAPITIYEQWLDDVNQQLNEYFQTDEERIENDVKAFMYSRV